MNNIKVVNKHELYNAHIADWITATRPWRWWPVLKQQIMATNVC